MSAHAAIASNETLGLIVLVTLALLWLRNRSFVHDLSADANRGWHTVTRLAVVVLLALIGWVSLFDNWRHLTAIPFWTTRQWESQRVQIDPPSAEVRAITFVLLAVLLVLTACLIARHVGGYVLQGVLAMGAIFAWMPLFVIRMHFAIDMAMGFDGSWTSPGDVAAYLGFAALSWAFDISLIATSFVGLACLTAIPVTLLLDLLRLRHPRITAEAQPFFNAIGGRTS